MSELKDAIEKINAIYERQTDVISEQKAIKNLLTGNGNPKSGLLFKVAWLEKVVYWVAPIVLLFSIAIGNKELAASIITMLVK